MVTISARVRIPDDLTGLLQGEWEQIIAQAGYSEQDAEIVRRYIIEKTPQIDVAVELDMARSTRGCPSTVQKTTSSGARTHFPRTCKQADTAVSASFLYLFWPFSGPDVGCFVTGFSLILNVGTGQFTTFLEGFFTWNTQATARQMRR